MPAGPAATVTAAVHRLAVTLMPPAAATTGTVRLEAGATAVIKIPVTVELSVRGPLATPLVAVHAAALPVMLGIAVSVIVLVARPAAGAKIVVIGFPPIGTFIETGVTPATALRFLISEPETYLVAAPFPHAAVPVVVIACHVKAPLHPGPPAVHGAVPGLVQTIGAAGGG